VLLALTFKNSFVQVIPPTATNSTSLYSHSKIHISPSVIQDSYLMRTGTVNPETIPFTTTDAFEGFFAQGSIMRSFKISK
jgi:hypothetical protein